MQNIPVVVSDTTRTDVQSVVSRLASALLFATATMLPIAAIAQTPVEATIDTGVVVGETSGGVASWKGIPFAQPPVGDLRWRAPQPVDAWEAPRQATKYANDCMQTAFDVEAAPIGTEPAEDCLYVNVWRPAEGGDDLPVMVWIYGGAFVNGGASTPIYSGENLARNDVVVVSLNYRLGRFGTFAHPQLTAENPDEGRFGNYGIMDQIAALEWVQRNVASFGGDPENVTVVGESAGGVSIHLLATSPKAEGLFDKAVIMSGTAGTRTGTATLEDIEGLGVTFARQFDISEDDPQALEKLRGLSAEDVTGDLNFFTAGTHTPVTWTGPFVDGEVVVDPGVAYEEGNFIKGPMMIGATSADLGGKTGFMVGGARQISGRLAEAGVPVYQYRFSYVAESADATAGATHASDIPFFFNTQETRYGAAVTVRDNSVGDTISTYVTNFVKTGDPNSRALPEWPVYEGPDSAIMDFAVDGKVVVGPDPWAEEIDAAQEQSYPDYIKRVRSE